jgi:MazG family protein
MSDQLRRLREIVARLRGPDGCPWDREQTHASLRAGLVEEAYEVIDAIDRGDDAHLCEELGDFLLQVFMHSQIAAEAGRFDLDAVAREVADKLVRRHPHVFGDRKLDDSGAVLRQWEEIKRAEKGAQGSLMEGVPPGLPALIRAEKVQKKAARVGFDWPEPSGVVAKVREELAEVETAMSDREPAALEHEIGDLLFSVVNLARQLGIDSEVVLHQAANRFAGRFREVEKLLRARGLDPARAGLEALDAAWNEVKAMAKGH